MPSAHRTGSMDKNHDEIALMGVKWEFVKEFGKNHWVARCTKCPQMSLHRWSPRISPDNVYNNMVRRGWEIARGRPLVCADCSTSPRQQAQLKENAVNKPTPITSELFAHGPEILPTEPTEPSTTVPTTPTVPNLKLARKVYAALDEHFDEDKKMYRDGWNDLTISKSLGVSQDVVTRIRREAYGELAMDPKLAKLSDDIELLRMEYDDAQQKMVAVSTRLVALEAQLRGYTARKA